MPDQLLRENSLELQRRTRLLKYVYSGVIDKEVEGALLQGIDDWYDDSKGGRQMTVRQLRDLFDEFFWPDEEDEVNLSAQAWEQVAFQITAEPTEGYGDLLGTIEVKSTDCRFGRYSTHEIRLVLHLIHGHSRVKMTYTGPQRFKTFKGALGSELRWEKDFLCPL